MATIDFDRLNKACDERRIYALQLEIGDICEQGCTYCYMNALPQVYNQLSDEKITEILHDCKHLGISAVEWLGGEPLLRQSIFEHMGLATDLGLRNNVWTGGLPLTDMKVLRQTLHHARYGLISVHVSTVNPKTYRRLHPERPASDLTRIVEAVERLLELGYPADQIINSVTFTGMQTADDMIETIDYFERRFGILTSLNVYHTYLRPGQSRSELEQFIPDRAAVSKVYRRWTRQYNVERLPMNCVNKQYCSATMAVLCDGSVTPCATIRPTDAPKLTNGTSLFDIFQDHREELIFGHFRDPENLPPECRTCVLADCCWGCRSRAFAAGEGIYGRDPRCFRHPAKSAKHPGNEASRSRPQSED